MSFRLNVVAPSMGSSVLNKKRFYFVQQFLEQKMGRRKFFEQNLEIFRTNFGDFLNKFRVFSNKIRRFFEQNSELFSNFNVWPENVERYLDSTVPGDFVNASLARPPFPPTESRHLQGTTGYCPCATDNTGY
jgi:hypothetical protein